MTADSMHRHHGVVVGRFPVRSRERCARSGLGVHEAGSNPESPQTASGETDQDTCSQEYYYSAPLPLSI